MTWGTTHVTVTELLPPGRPLLVAAARVLPAVLTLVAAAAGGLPSLYVVGLSWPPNVSFGVGIVLTKRLPAPPNRIAATGWQRLLSRAARAPPAVVEGRPPVPTARNLVGLGCLS
jgi:hypothetical protein